jgi:hypothetical protein
MHSEHVYAALQKRSEMSRVRGWCHLPKDEKKAYRPHILIKLEDNHPLSEDT